LKKTLSIFFIVLLLSFQYARQLSYIGCKFFYTTANNDCGCDSILNPNSENNTELPDMAQHKHIRADDFVKHFYSGILLQASILSKKTAYHFSNSPISEGTKDGLFRPPDA
jgi:hypothetical protein